MHSPHQERGHAQATRRKRSRELEWRGGPVAAGHWHIGPLRFDLVAQGSTLGDAAHSKCKRHNAGRRVQSPEQGGRIWGARYLTIPVVHKSTHFGGAVGGSQFATHDRMHSPLRNAAIRRSGRSMNTYALVNRSDGAEERRVEGLFSHHFLFRTISEVVPVLYLGRDFYYIFE